MKDTITTKVINLLRKQYASHPKIPFTISEGVFSVTVYIVDVGWTNIQMNQLPDESGCYHIDMAVLPIQVEYTPSFGVSYHKNLIVDDSPQDIIDRVIDTLYFSSTV